MAPGLVAGDNVLTWPASPAEVRRGDVIVFSAGETGQIHIKRVVGLPGDVVQLIGGTVHLNGDAVSLTPADTFIQAGDGRSVDRLVETLPGGVPSYYVLDIDPKGMGDNTPVLTVAAGEFFVMGDHRDNSLDSRFAQFGPVPAGAVEGWLWLLYWNDTGQPLTGRTPD
jgi:signal peptidase I